MAINVNTVYTTVLSILNKEQRGYITPYEFNQLATQVQLEIFESYFENLNQQLKVGENASEYANRVKLLQEKISRFEVEENIAVAASVADLSTLTETLHRLGTIHFNNLSYLPVEIQQVTKHEFNLNRRSKLTAPSLDWPIYYKEGNTIRIEPAETSTVAQAKYTVEYIRKPKDVVWNYTLGGVGQYLHSTAAPNQNFEIDDTDQTEVILKILMYSGVVIRDQEIIQAASGAAARQDQLQSS